MCKWSHCVVSFKCCNDSLVHWLKQAVVFGGKNTISNRGLKLIRVAGGFLLFGSNVYLYKMMVKLVFKKRVCYPSFRIRLPNDRQTSFGFIFEGLWIFDKLREISIYNAACLRTNHHCQMILGGFKTWKFSLHAQQKCSWAMYVATFFYHCFEFLWRERCSFFISVCCVFTLRCYAN